MEHIPISGPSITQKEIDYVTDAVTNAWYQDANVYHERFESAFAEYLGVRHAVSLPSCTSAIHLSLMALGVGPGDEVVVPDITWIATSAPVSYVGATPVFADIDARTWCLSPESFEECITPRTKAVIPVDLYGAVADMDPITEIARRHGISIVEDAAQALGASYNGRKAGALGDVGVFSFHGTKTLTTGEGGMLVTDNTEVFDRVLVLRDHGREPGAKTFWNAEVAHKYRMSSMQAALGLAQLERIEELVAHKREIFSWYDDEIGATDGITLNYEAPTTTGTYWMVTAVLDRGLGIDKERLIEAMNDRNIACRPFFYPLSSLPAYENSDEALKARERNQTSYTLSPYSVNLPSAMSMTEDKARYVSSVLKDILAR